MMEQVRIGVVPVRRSFLSMREAVRQKQLFMKEIERIRPSDVCLTGIDDICENGILWDAAQAPQVAAKMTENRIDALFLAFCDFGEEVAAARVAAALGLPVLVWGARDERPNSDEQRGRDTQCGIFAATKVLARLGVTYSYICNVPASSWEFHSGFETFVRTVSVVKSLRGLRIAQIGQRPAAFMSVAASEAALLEQLGVEVIPLGIDTVLRRMETVRKEEAQQIEACVGGLKSRVDVSRMTEEQLVSMAAFKLAVKGSLAELGCRAAALECWSAFPPVLGFTPCFMAGELTDEGFPLSCETDLNGAVTSVLLQAAALGDSAPFFADLTIRHPEDDNAELLWHCGPFPYSLRDPDARPWLAQGRGRFPLKKGAITIARLDDLCGAYRLVAVQGAAVDGPPTTGTYVYFKTGDWKRVEEKFVFGPYIHHVAGCYGNYVRCLKEAVRYIGPVEWDEPGTGPASL